MRRFFFNNNTKKENRKEKYTNIKSYFPLLRFIIIFNDRLGWETTFIKIALFTHIYKYIQKERRILSKSFVASWKKVYSGWSSQYSFILLLNKFSTVRERKKSLVANRKCKRSDKSLKKDFLLILLR